MTSSKTKVLFLALLFVIGMSSIMSGKLQQAVTIYANKVRVAIVNDTLYLQSLKEQYLDQAHTINVLEKRMHKLERNAVLTVMFASELNKIKNTKKIYSGKGLILSKVLSYVEIGEYGKVWLDFKAFKEDRIYGLLQNGYTAGIVIAHKGEPMGLLQSEEKCNFSVMIGEKKVPGIVFGNGQYMEARFIPAWMDVDVGDEVYTSGLDTIFFNGVKVGKIKEVLSGDLYKTAVVETYSDLNVLGYVHIVN